MLGRKRRASSISSKQDEDPLQIDDSTPETSPVQQSAASTLSIATGGNARKKRRLDPTELCQQLYDSVRNIKKEDGSMLCDTFIRAPKRRQEPSYYDVVTSPIDLLKIQQKLKTDSYDDLDDLMLDFDLLTNNAKAFYKPGSAEYQDAEALAQHVQTNRQRILEYHGIAVEDEHKPRVSLNASRQSLHSGDDHIENDDADQYEELFAAVMTAVDPTTNSRPLHTMFLLLPSKKVYPEYYDLIEHPIDLRLIATKIKMHAYSSLLEMERDLLQMVKNACKFNEPGSEIYKDAKALKQIFTQKRAELELAKTKPARRDKSLSSSAIAALKEEIESSDDEETSKKGEGPMWTLFDNLYNAPGFSENPGVTGPPLGASLWKLPVRRFHAHYYELIKQPISMGQIHKKLKKGEYANITDLIADFILMLNNAKTALPPTHRTHRDAVKMMKLMNAKLIEDSPEQESSELDEDEVDETTSTFVATSEKPERRKPGRPRVNSGSSLPSTPGSTTQKSTRTPVNATTKKRIMSLQRFLVDYTIDDRRPIELFMEKPSRKVYPDYYDVIQNPIDMNTIEQNIRNDRYQMIEDVVVDYKQMFANCRLYNEEGSSIYEDANILEQALNEKLKEFPGLGEIRKPSMHRQPRGGRKPKQQPHNRLKAFFESIRDYQDPKTKRQLSFIFTKLPSKMEYPDYYDIIKEPMDMEKISQKLRNLQYEHVDELAADFLLMLENACKYNEPDSQIYKDALVLQQLTLQLKQQYRNELDVMPDVSLAVQELFLTIFTALYNHQDEDGRCYTDSMSELPEYDEQSNGIKARGISLDLIKRRLDKCVYKRLDIFQEDIFACLERARRLSRTDSDVFHDSIELQTFFIHKRDELCKGTLRSTAFSYNLERLLQEVEATRQQKLSSGEHHENEDKEQEHGDEEDEEEKSVSQLAAKTADGESVVINHQVYSQGDFVYVQKPENKIPSIMLIERLWTTPNNEKMMQGLPYLRPHETYHVPSRKFLEKEVFKGNLSETIPMENVRGRCCVMSVRDYIKSRPEGFDDDKDVYVCESRYNMRLRVFIKIKHWRCLAELNNAKLIARETPLELKRVMSVFKERVEKHKGELEELKLQEALVEKEKPNVQCSQPPADAEAGSVYYQQYNTMCSGTVKVGDFVYVATQSGKQSIAQILQIWEHNDGKSSFKGPWLLTPAEVTLTAGSKLACRQELFLTPSAEVSPVVAIIGRCAVLDTTEFVSLRPTEIPESDIYLCDSVYDEANKSLNKLMPGNLRKFQYSDEVTQDEIYFFRTPIKLPVALKQEPVENLGLLEDSMDETVRSLSTDLAAVASPAPSSTNTPMSTKVKVKQSSKKTLTGYIIYSCEVRKGICQNNPEATFGDISRMVGTEWKNLPASVKQNYEDKATKLNEETAAARKFYYETMAMQMPGVMSDIPASTTFECKWENCDYQFEAMADYTEHCIGESSPHVQRHALPGETQFVCLWRNCTRMRKTNVPFPSAMRLVKHVRDVHLNKGGKFMYPFERSQNFTPSKQRIQQQQQQQQQSPNAQIQYVQPGSESPTMSMMFDQNSQSAQDSNLSMSSSALSLEPMFITVPPRTERVVQSETYMRYIEKLQANSPSNAAAWKATLTPSTPANVSNLQLNSVAHWLGGRARQNGADVVQALCNLRNYMLNDAFGIQRSLY